MPHIDSQRKQVLELFARYVSVLPWFNINVLHKFYINVFLHFEKEENLCSYKRRAITCADLLHSPLVKTINFNVFAFKNEAQQLLRIEVQEDQVFMMRAGNFMLAYAAECREHFLGPKYLESYRLKGNMIVDPDVEAGRIVRNIARELNQFQSLGGKKKSVAYFLNILNKDKLGPQYSELIKVMEGLQAYDPDSGKIPEELKSLGNAANDSEETITIKLPRHIQEKILEEFQIKNPIEKTSTLLSLIVGIDRYADERIYPLDAAFKDAQAFQQYLAENRIKKSDYQDLSFFNEQATRKNLLDAFDHFAEKANSGDTFLFYFAGYGGVEEGGGATQKFQQSNVQIETDGKRMLICHDSLTGSHGIALSELTYKLNAFPKDCKCILILDCGFERQMMVKLEDGPKVRSLAWKESNRHAINFEYANDESFDGTAEYDGITLFAGNREDNVYETTAGGYFTTGLIDALKRSKNQISYSDLISGDKSIKFSSTAQSPTFDVVNSFSSSFNFLAGFIKETESSQNGVKPLLIHINILDENDSVEKTILQMISDVENVAIVNLKEADFFVNFYNSMLYFSLPSQPYSPLAKQIETLREEEMKGEFKRQLQAVSQWHRLLRMNGTDEQPLQKPLKIEARLEDGDWIEVTDGTFTMDTQVDRAPNTELYQKFEIRIKNLSTQPLFVGALALSSDFSISSNPYDSQVIELQPNGNEGDTRLFYDHREEALAAITFDGYKEVYNWKEEWLYYKFIYNNRVDFTPSLQNGGLLQPALPAPLTIDRSTRSAKSAYARGEGVIDETEELKFIWGTCITRMELRNSTHNVVSGDLEELLDEYLNNKQLSPFIKNLYPDIPLKEGFLQRIQEARSNGEKSLNLSELNLDHFPPELFTLTDLESLDISNNAIKEIPEEINRLKNLQVLKATNNPISIIHENIGQLERLRSLHLDECKLERFPKALLGLKAIEELILRNNFIKFVPYAIRNFSILSKIDLKGNPVINIPEEYLECSITEFIDYLSPFEPLSQNEQPLVLAVGLDYDEKLRNINPELELIIETLKSTDVEVLDLYNPDGLNLCETIYQNQDRLSILHFAAFTMHELKLRDGTRQPVEPHEWAEMFSCIRLKHFETKLVFLNCCDSEDIITHLTKGNFMAAMGLPDKVEDQLALEVTREFYGSLAEGKTIQESYDETFRKFAD